MKKIASLLLATLTLFLWSQMVLADGGQTMVIETNGTPLVMAKTGNDLRLGVQSADQDIEFFAGATEAGEFDGTTGNFIANLNLILSAQDQQLQILSGVAAVDADVITAAPDTSTVAYLGSNTSGNRIAMISNIADAVGGSLAFYKTRAAAGAWNANTIIASGDDIGEIIFYGSDGAAYINAARIFAESGGTPGLTTDMPGALVFQTVPDSSGTLTTALTIEPDQDLLMTGDLYLADGQNLGFVAGNSANAACDTTCTGGCVMGFDAGTTAFVACSSALADTCICTK